MEQLSNPVQKSSAMGEMNCVLYVIVVSIWLSLFTQCILATYLRVNKSVGLRLKKKKLKRKTSKSYYSDI